MSKKIALTIALLTFASLVTFQSVNATDAPLTPVFTEVAQLNTQADSGVLAGIEDNSSQEAPWFGREYTTYNTGSIDAFGHPHLDPLFIGMKYRNLHFIFDVKNNSYAVNTNLGQAPDNKGGYCREPAIWQIDRKGLYLIYYNKENKPEEELNGDLFNYTYLYDSRVQKSVFIEGMVIGLVDLNNDNKPEIITYRRNKRHSDEKGIISAYSIENSGSKDLFVKKISSGKTSHTIEGALRHRYGGDISDLYAWDVDIRKRYIGKYKITFLMDAQTSGLFINIKKRSKKEIKEFSEFYKGSGGTMYHHLNNFFASPNKKLYPIPVRGLKSSDSERVAKIYGLYGTEDSLYPKNAYLKFEAFNRIRVDKTDHDLMILDSLDEFSCGIGSVGNNFYCDTTDGYSEGQYVLEKGSVLNFGFYPDDITFIDTQFNKEKIALGLNKKKTIIFKGNLDQKVDSQASRMDWYWRFANVNYSPLQQLAILPTKDLLGYSPEFLISYYDNVYAIDPQWNLHIYKTNVVQGKQGSTSTESW